MSAPRSSPTQCQILAMGSSFGPASSDPTVPHGIGKAKWARPFLRLTSDHILGTPHVHRQEENFVTAPMDMHEPLSRCSRSTLLHARVTDVGLYVDADDPHGVIMPRRRAHGDPRRITKFFAGIGGCTAAASFLQDSTVTQAFEFDPDVAYLHVRLHPLAPMDLCDSNDRRTWPLVIADNGTWTMTCPCQPFSPA